MKKISLVILILGTLVSCSESDNLSALDCSQEVYGIKVDKSEVASKNDGYTTINNNISLSEDTEYYESTYFKKGINLNGFTLTVYGNVKVKGYLNGGGVLIYYDILNVDSATIQNNPTFINEGVTLSVEDIIKGSPIVVPCNLEVGDSYKGYTVTSLN